jgi:hypothetical protein
VLEIGEQSTPISESGQLKCQGAGNRKQLFSIKIGWNAKESAELDGKLLQLPTAL